MPLKSEKTLLFNEGRASARGGFGIIALSALRLDSCRGLMKKTPAKQQHENCTTSYAGPGFFLDMSLFFLFVLNDVPKWSGK